MPDKLTAHITHTQKCVLQELENGKTPKIPHCLKNNKEFWAKACQLKQTPAVKAHLLRSLMMNPLPKSLVKPPFPALPIRLWVYSFRREDIPTMLNLHNPDSIESFVQALTVYYRLMFLLQYESKEIPGRLLPFLYSAPYSLKDYNLLQKFRNCKSIEAIAVTIHQEPIHQPLQAKRPQSLPNLQSTDELKQRRIALLKRQIEDLKEQLVRNNTHWHSCSMQLIRDLVNQMKHTPVIGMKALRLVFRYMEQIDSVAVRTNSNIELLTFLLQTIKDDTESVFNLFSLHFQRCDQTK